jgi:polygalacturonase
LVEFIGCNGIHLEGFSTSYKHMWSIHPTCCDNLVIRNLKVRSTETNGDGIDIDSCRHVLIDSCDIASGDDCISLKSGRGEEAFIENRPTEDVHIVNCTLEGRGFSCVGIGTECSAGIRDVLIEHCRVARVFKNAFYIKSRAGRGAFIENITVRDIDAANMRQGFLRINQTSAGTQDANPVPGLAGVTLYRNFHFSDIRVQDAPVLVDAVEIDADKMLDGLVLEKISGTCAKGVAIANARNVIVKEMTVTGCEGSLLRLGNVTGKGLENASAIPAPASPTVVSEPATPYRLH